MASRLLSALRRPLLTSSNLIRCTPAAFPIALPAPCTPVFNQCRRSLHSFTPLSFRTVAAPVMSAHGHGHEGEAFHGTDFLSRENVERRVLAVLGEIEKVDKTKLKDLNSTFKSLGLDSLDEVEVVILLEEEFVIDIQDEVASNILSIQDAINYVVNHPFAATDEVHH